MASWDSIDCEYMAGYFSVIWKACDSISFINMENVLADVCPKTRMLNHREPKAKTLPLESWEGVSSTCTR